MGSLRYQRHLCHVIASLADHALVEGMLANIRLFASPLYQHTVIVLHKEARPPRRLPPHTNCLELALQGSRFDTMKTCTRALKALKPDICHTYGDAVLPFQWLAAHALVALKIHHVSDPTPPRKGVAALKRTLSYRFFGASADYVIAPNEAHIHWLQKDAGIATEKVKQVRTGIDVRRHRPLLREVATGTESRFIGSLPISSARFVIALQMKGLDEKDAWLFFKEFIAARKHSSAFASQALLLVLGNSRHLTAYRRLLMQHGVDEGQVLFCNQTLESERFYHLTDAIGLLGADSSLTPIQLEAMAMGLPIISRRETGQDVVNNHPFRWGTESGDLAMRHQMLTLFSDAKLRIQLGRISREYVLRRHQHTEHYNRYDALYRLLDHKTAANRPSPQRNANVPTNQRLTP